MSDIVHIYDKFAPEIAKVYDQQSHEVGINEFISKLKLGSNILDLGSGMGKDVNTFNTLGFHSVGLDGSLGMVKEAKKRYSNDKFYLGDVKKPPFPEKSFDAVWSWSVFTHLNITDKRKTLKEVARILKKGGWFSQTVWRGEGIFINKHIEPRSHYLLKSTSWAKLYKESGFESPKIKYIKGKGRDSLRLTAQKTVN